MRQKSLVSAKRSFALFAFALFPVAGFAATYTVGPAGSGAQYAQLRDVFTQRDLAPGVIVQVRGSATYDGGIVVGADDGGTAADPVVIRWDRAAGTSRPILSGGVHTIKFEESNHVVFEGFQVSGGTNSCVFSAADDVTVRDNIIRDCPSHGVLGADRGSGSLMLEYNEIYNAGSGTTRHPVYVSSDPVAFPDAVFRMRFNYVHDGKGGNLVKTRHQRNEIYYNWLEGAFYQEIELIGPDCEAWNGTPPDIAANSDIVGNVIIHTSAHNAVIRAGGDLNGRSRGLVRIVDNTLLIDRATGGASAVLVQLGVKGLEMHNNLIYQPASGIAPAILSENTTPDTPICGFADTRPWVNGVRQVAGSNNWVETGATNVPPEWVATLKGGEPLLTNIPQRLLRPTSASPLRNAGLNRPPSPPNFPMPWPLPSVLFDPPLRVKLAIGDQHARLPQGAFTVDIGALEDVDIDQLIGPFEMPDAQPLVPGRANVSSSKPTQAVKPTTAKPVATHRASPRMGRPSRRGSRLK